MIKLVVNSRTYKLDIKTPVYAKRKHASEIKYKNNPCLKDIRSSLIHLRSSGSLKSLKKYDPSIFMKPKKYSTKNTNPSQSPFRICKKQIFQKKKLQSEEKNCIQNLLAHEERINQKRKFHQSQNLYFNFLNKFSKDDRKSHHKWKRNTNHTYGKGEESKMKIQQKRSLHQKMKKKDRQGQKRQKLKKKGKRPSEVLQMIEFKGWEVQSFDNTLIN